MKPLLVGIAGGTGSGKSTVARRVSEAVRGASAIALDMDAYYRNLTQLTLEQRRHVNWDHPDAFDFDLLLAHLESLAARQPIDKPVYDFVSHLRSDQHVRVEPADVVVVDGILLLADARIRARCDVTAYRRHRRRHPSRAPHPARHAHARAGRSMRSSNSTSAACGRCTSSSSSPRSSTPR